MIDRLAEAMEDLVDLLINDCDAAELSGVLEASLRRLGELGQPAFEAFNELITTRGECPEFDAGVDLLDRWIGNKPRVTEDAKKPPGFPAAHENESKTLGGDSSHAATSSEAHQAERTVRVSKDAHATNADHEPFPARSRVGEVKMYILEMSPGQSVSTHIGANHSKQLS